MNDIEYLRVKHAELLKRKEEEAERQRLLKEIQELEEEGTVKGNIKKAALNLREHLKKKGGKFKETGDRLKGKDQRTQEEGSWKPSIVSMSEKSEFGTKKEVTNKEWKPAIGKMVKK